MSFLSNLSERARLLRTALARRYIWTDLTQMVQAHGFHLRDVRSNTHPFEFVRALGGDVPPAPDFGRIGSVKDFELANTFAWNSEPSVGKFLGELAFHTRARTVVELGCFVGWSSAHLAVGLHAAANGGRLWCVDSDERYLNAARRNLEKLSLGDGVTWVRGLSLEDHVLTALPESIDLLFIDTSHEYEPTLAELRTYAPRLAPGGCIAMHDTISQDGCRRALRDRWDDFASMTFATEFGNGVTVLRCKA